jgi:hypothetical protein
MSDFYTASLLQAKSKRANATERVERTNVQENTERGQGHPKPSLEREKKKFDDLPKRLVRCKVFCILTKFGGLLTQTLTALEDILWGKGFPLVPRADLQ